MQINKSQSLSNNLQNYRTQNTCRTVNSINKHATRAEGLITIISAEAGKFPCHHKYLATIVYIYNLAYRYIN